MIVPFIDEVRGLRQFQERHLVVASGGFDPLHEGHVYYLRAAAQLGPLVVLVNGDGFLRRKKGGAFLPLKTRLEVVAALQGVAAVVAWDDGSPTVSAALEILKPTVFAKGGDRDSAANVPEAEVCRRLGCAVAYGVGGYHKAESSSALLAKYGNGRSGGA